MAGHSEKIAHVGRNSPALFGQSTESILTSITKMEAGPDGQSRQQVLTGRQPLPFNAEEISKLRDTNEHHSTCLEAKAMAIAGLGFLTEEEKIVLRRQIKAMVDGGAEEGVQEVIEKIDYPEPRESKVDTVLDPLCDTESSWRETLAEVAEDFVEYGTGYLEVTRRERGRTISSPGATTRVNAGAISGIFHLPFRDVRVFLEDRRHRHFEINRHPYLAGFSSADGDNAIKRFAMFGDREEFIARGDSIEHTPNTVGFHMPRPDQISEVIAIRTPSRSESRWYGYPDWLSAAASLELSQNLKQYRNDFFVNRGVPEFVMMAWGIHDKKIQQEIENSLLRGVGSGNSHRSLVAFLNNTPESSKIEIQRLTNENDGDDGKGEEAEQIAMAIVTAHRVPPLLAGIQIPGKLGATNELPNALMAFQILCVGPKQQIVEQRLAKTLGNPNTNGGLGLTAQDFRLRKITEEIDISSMDTVARMRQSPMQARSEGRDLNDGVKS